MPNHIHFLLESSDQPENLAKFMKSIAQKYAQYINASHKRTGTLWEGRFKSSPVSSDSYLLACSRYIELNPVRAKLVSDPGIYKWSGYGFKIGQIDNYALLDTDSAYADMGHDDRQRQSNYKKWTMESIPDGEWDNIRKAVNKGVVFGNEHFKEKLEKLLGRRLDAREKGRPVKH